MCFSTKFGTVLSYLKFSWKKYIVLLAALVLRKTQNVGFALSVLFISKIWSNLNCRFIPVNLLFWDLYFGQVEQKFCGINTAQETSDKVSLLITSGRRRPCRCRYISVVFLVVAVAVSTHLCVVCRVFCCPMSLFQGHVACRNFTLRGPFSFLIYLYWKTVNLFVLTTLWVLKFS